MEQTGAYTSFPISFNYVQTIILALIPLTNYILGGVERIVRGQVVCGILWFVTVGYFGIGIILDLISICVYKNIRWLVYLD